MCDYMTLALRKVFLNVLDFETNEECIHIHAYKRYMHEESGE